MGLFWKRNRRDPAYLDRQAERIAFGLLKAQRRLAQRINLRLRKVKLPVLLSLMVFLGLAFGIYCVYLVLAAFF